MKKQLIDYSLYADSWKNYFTAKGFQIHYEDSTNNNKEHFISLRGCKPQIRVEIYAGRYRNDTETHGCICADFSETYNKVSHCPVYCDLNESETNVWKAIEMLMNAGKDFSNQFGKIIKQSGGWNYNPPIYNKKEKNICKK